MNQNPDRPPIVPFMLAFAGLVAAAVCLAALSSTPERGRARASAADERDIAAPGQSAGKGSDARDAAR